MHSFLTWVNPVFDASARKQRCTSGHHHQQPACRLIVVYWSLQLSILINRDASRLLQVNCARVQFSELRNWVCGASCIISPTKFNKKFIWNAQPKPQQTLLHTSKGNRARCSQPPGCCHTWDYRSRSLLPVETKLKQNVKQYTHTLAIEFII